METVYRRTFLTIVAASVAGCRRGGGEVKPTEARLVTVGGAITETVFALGLGGQVVGTDTSSTFPAEAAGRAQVGYQRALSSEGVLGLRPTLVLASQDAGPPAALEQLRGAGVEVLIVKAEPSVEGAKAKARALGERLGRKAEAEALVARIEREVSQSSALPRRGKPRVLAVFARGPGAVMVSGQGSAAVSMIELAGGESAIPAVEGTKPLTAEAAVAARPDVLLATTHGVEGLGGVDGLLRAPGLADTPAGRARRVVVLDDLLLLGFGPRTGEAATALVKALHGAV